LITKNQDTQPGKQIGTHAQSLLNCALLISIHLK